jgi:glycosyltransferase involved in cell wall biosynthesis
VTDLTVIVPTRDEAANVTPLVRRASAALASLGLVWELVFVDDSDDATPAQVREAERQGQPVRLVHRPPGARPGGLGGAVLLGFEQAAESKVIAVMDGDLQHPPELLTSLVRAVQQDGADVAVASRFSAPGGGPGCLGPWRRVVSHGSRSSVRLLFRDLRRVTDPLSGFFAFRRSVIEGVELRPEGFKILLEVLVRGSWRTITEIPFGLAPRHHGESKAHLYQGLAFGRQLARLLTLQ